MRAVLLSMLLAGVAYGDADTAARAFANGQAAQLEGDFERAAQSFELAFTISPAKEALRSAVRARQQAGQLARAGTLATLLLEKYSADAPSAKLANEVIAEAQTKFGRLSVHCTTPCTVAIDGRAISLATAPAHVVFISAGKQTLTVTFDGVRDVTKDVTIAVGATVDVRVEPPVVVAPAPIRPPTTTTTEPPVVRAKKPAPESGVSPAVVIVGGVMAVGLAGVGVWSGLDTNDAHVAYVANPTHAGWEAGRSKQQRTNILFGSAAGVGVATLAVAIFWTRWRGSSDKELSPPIAITPQNGGLGISYGSSF